MSHLNFCHVLSICLYVYLFSLSVSSFVFSVFFDVRFHTCCFNFLFHLDFAFFFHSLSNSKNVSPNKFTLFSSTSFWLVFYWLGYIEWRVFLRKFIWHLSSYHKVKTYWTRSNLKEKRRLQINYQWDVFKWSNI